MEYWSRFMSTNESSRNKTLKVHKYCIICKVTLFFIVVQLFSCCYWKRQECVVISEVVLVFRVLEGLLVENPAARWWEWVNLQVEQVLCGEARDVVQGEGQWSRKQRLLGIRKSQTSLARQWTELINRVASGGGVGKQIIAWGFQ